MINLSHSSQTIILISPNTNRMQYTSQCPSSPRSSISKAMSPKIIRKPEYNSYKRIIENRQKRSQKLDSFVGFYSPRKHQQNIKSFMPRKNRLERVQQGNNENVDISNLSQVEIFPVKQQVISFPMVQSFKQQNLKTSDKQNSRQRRNSKQSSSKIRFELQTQNNILKLQLQSLRTQNSLLHSQIQNSYYEIQNLKQNQLQNLTLKKSLSNLQHNLIQKQQTIEFLEQTICSLNIKMTKLQSPSCQLLIISDLQKLNSQHQKTIKKLTQQINSLQIQLYLLKTKQHDFTINHNKQKQIETLINKNKQLRVLNSQLRQRINYLSSGFSILQYSPELTQRTQKD